MKLPPPSPVHFSSPTCPGNKAVFLPPLFFPPLFLPPLFLPPLFLPPLFLPSLFLPPLFLPSLFLPPLFPPSSLPPSSLPPSSLSYSLLFLLWVAGLKSTFSLNMFILELNTIFQVLLCYCTPASMLAHVQCLQPSRTPITMRFAMKTVLSWRGAWTPCSVPPMATFHCSTWPQTQ